MRSLGKGAALAVLLACWGCFAATAALGAGSAAHMYEPTTVDVVNLTLSPQSIAALGSEPDEYVEGTFSLAETDGTPSGVGSFSTPITVGIRLKGQGSARTLDQKAAFKIKFNWVKGQKFLGLKKLTLNNMVQDQSQIHEALAYRVFRSSGVPASRTGYAYVYVNGADYGMHLNIETLDEVALESRFGPFQHLYEADEYATDVETGPADTPAEVEAAAKAYEVDEGSETDLSDLEALIESVNDPAPGDWSSRVEPVADLKEMTRMWAVEKYIGHWDGYSGEEGQFLPNNYYLFSDSSGRFQMLPWGTDQTWSTGLPFSGDAGEMFDRCLADASCAEMYRRSLRDMQKAIAADDLSSLASELAALLEPWEEIEVGNGARHEFTLSQIESGVASALSFISVRPGDLTSFLAGEPPEAPAEDVAVSASPALLRANGTATTTITARVTDVAGNPIPGDQISFSSSDPGQSVGPVVDHDDGRYTATVTASNSPGQATITVTDASVSPHIAGATTLTEPPLAAGLSVSAQPASLPADGSATTTLTAVLTGAGLAPVPGDAIAFASSDSSQTIGPVTDHGDGTYTATLTGSTTVGVATITATDTSPATNLTGVTVLTQSPLPAISEAPVLSAPTGPAGSLPTPVRVLRIGHVGLRRASLLMRVESPGGDTIGVSGTFLAAGLSSKACSGEASVAAAGSTLVECALSPALLSSLERHWRRVRLTATLSDGIASVESAVRVVRLRRAE